MYGRRSDACIEQIVDRILAENNILNYPVGHIPEILGRRNIEKLEIDAEKDFCAYYYELEDGQRKIAVNINIDTPERTNFSIVHELGHHFLEHELTDAERACTEEDIFGETQNKLQEREADVFAACFLMPKYLMVKEYLKFMDRMDLNPDRGLYIDHQGCNVETYNYFIEWFKPFGASKEALRYRMINLKLMIWNMGGYQPIKKLL